MEPIETHFGQTLHTCPGQLELHIALKFLTMYLDRGTDPDVAVKRTVKLTRELIDGLS